MMIETLRSSAVAAALTLLAVYAAVLALTDLSGNIGSDVGGKTATLDALVESGTLDLGFWAAEHDPDGSVHPMYSTGRFGDEWVNVTTLPMILAAWPLAEVGGLGLAMLIPMLGSVAAALAARRLAIDLDGDSTLAFWAVGLGSPAAFYAVSFWEHSVGLGLMAWGIVMLHSAFGGAIRYAAFSGLLFGAAASLRQEALVYGFVAGLVLVAVLATGWSREDVITSTQRLARTARSAGAMASSALLVLFLNRALEQAVLGEAFRDGRSAGTASSFGSDLGRRWADAVLTTFAPFGSVTAIETILGLVLVGAVIAATLQLQRGADARAAMIVIGVMYGLIAFEIVANGLSFVPSLLIVTPLAIVGATIGVQHREAQPLAALALGAMPLVWLVQYSSGMAAQWGGRYLLASGWILIVLAGALATPTVRRVVTVTASIGFAVAALGAVWTVQRTNVVADSSDQLALVDSEVVVFNSSLDARQTGSVSVAGQWLSADNADEFSEVLGVLGSAGIDQFAYVDVDFGGEPIDVEGFEIIDDLRIDYLSGFQYRVTFFARPAP